MILGARGDLAKLETFSTLVGLVERGVLDVPVVGVARSGWGLDEFRGSAESLRPNGMDPPGPAAEAQSGLVSEHPARTCSYRSASRRTNLSRTAATRPSSPLGATAPTCRPRSRRARRPVARSNACAAPGEDVGASSGQVN